MRSYNFNIKELAKIEANKSNVKYKMSAIIYDKSGLIAYGHNRKVSNVSRNTVLKFGVPYKSIHAEIDALLNIHPNDRYRLNRATIFIYRNGDKLAKPCKKCEHVLNMFNIRRIYWSE